MVPPFCKGRLGGFLQIVRKLDIACLVAGGPNTLLLDEPTNYISLDDLESFEAALALFPGPVLAVSPDRRFIRQFCGAIWELSGGVLAFDKNPLTT
jgi:macrolide transport system ATP-binding/permease protein